MKRAESTPIVPGMSAQRRIALVAAVLVPTVLLSSACSPQNPFKRSHDTSVTSEAARLKAAEAIAQRYVCSLVSVGEDSGNPGPSVALRVKLTDKPDVAKIMENYPSNNTSKSVIWTAPQIHAALSRNGLRIPYVGNDTPGKGPYGIDQVPANDWNGILNQGFNLGTDYKEGTLVTVEVTSSVYTDVDGGKKEAGFDGVQVCGTMELEGGVWQLSDKPSPITDHTTRDDSRWQ